MNMLRKLTHHRATMVLGVVALSLVLRADGCVTAERDLNGSVPITLNAEFTTAGSTESSSTDGSLSDADIDAIFEALADADVEAIRAAIEDDQPVLIAGLRAFVVENRGHTATRNAAIEIDAGSGLTTAATLSVPDNETGTEASAANGRVVVTDAYSGFEQLRDELQLFLESYVAGDLVQARALLSSVAWRATWTSTTPPPSQNSPDDFDWAVEVIVLVPAQYAIEVPNF